MAKDIKAITDRLEQGVKDVWNSDEYIAYLNTMSKFHSYSFGNILLILMQRPDATLVAGFKSWQTKFSRFVKKGEKGITILAPCPKQTIVTKKDANGNEYEEVIKWMSYRPVTVFDIAQTDGKDLPSYGVDELSGDVADYGKLMDALKAQASVPVVFEDMDDAHGYCTPTKIAIKNGMSELQTVKTMIHELAHHLMKHCSSENHEDRETKEVQAESVAYVVSTTLGLDTGDYSFGYVAGWAGNQNVKVLQGALAAIQKTADTIIKALA